MATDRQLLGAFGEQRVAKDCTCPQCKRRGTLIRLPPNFKCADIICDFCGYLAQVKTSRVRDIAIIPDAILGAAWGPQQDRMSAGIYFPLYLVLTNKDRKAYSVFYLAADLQEPDIFMPRSPLSPTAKRAGWQGFYYDLRAARDRFVRLK